LRGSTNGKINGKQEIPRIRQRQAFCLGIGVPSTAAVGVFILGAAAAFVVVTSRGPQRAVSWRSDATAPLELLVLEHDRDADSFIVRGIVRNSAATAVIGLNAAVSVYGPEGELIMTGHAAVAAPHLAPGEETPFVVIVSNAGAVDRYHLSFRTAAGVVPHIDRRAHSVLAGLS
jgi:hypothetical protein